MNMKQIRLFATLLMVALAATSCITWVDKNNENNNSSSSGGSNNLKAGQIVIKVYPDKDNKVSFSATTGKITIDWGDGNIDKLTPNGTMQEFSHSYPNNNLQTIYIESEKLQGLGKGGGSYAQVWGGKGVIKELYLGEMNELNELFCSNGGLTVLEIKKANVLTTLWCFNNQLTSLDLRGCTILNVLDCSENQLTSLNVSGLKALTTIYCGGNQLTSLNVSGCTALTSLYCSSNQLTSLNVSGCTALTSLYCSSNQLTSNNLNSLFESLPNRLAKEGTIDIRGNPGSSTCNIAIAKNKGWVFYY